MARPPGPAPGRGRGLSPALGRVGPYEIIDLLGQGGMAAVYLARDKRSGREVAVKVLARMRPSWVQRFSREFDAARRVEHPNVVKVLEAGEADGLAYYSMERIRGVTAARYVLDLGSEDPLPPPPPMGQTGPPGPMKPDLLARTLDVAIQLSRAVGAIHAVGLVHRDLKPGNVLVDGEGVVKLVDFGVAKWLEEQTSFTQVGHVVGSYSYMSPEQITGAEVDHRADMYGTGILLYELLTGAPPFRARRPQEYLWLHCTAQPTPVSRLLEDVPTDLDALLLRLLAKEPADRPESMASVEEELVGIRAHAEGSAAGARMEPATGTGDFEPLDLDVPIIEFDAEPGEEVTLRTSDPAVAKLPTPARGDDDATARLSADEVAEVRRKMAERARAREREPELSPESTRPLERKLVAPALKRQTTQSNVALAALVTPRHVGRKAELERLIGHLRAVKKAGVRAVLIEGEEGVGKTRLLHTFRGLAWVKGARVAIGRCHSAGGAFCAPFHDLLLRLAGPGLARSHHERVLGAERELLTRFFPALSSREVSGEAPSLREFGAEKDDLAGLFRAVCAAFRRAAQDAPLVLGIEDVQWADDGTVRLISSLLRRLAPPNPAQVLLVLTYRGEDVPAEASGNLLGAVSDLENVHTIELQPLGLDETRELIQSVTVDVPVSSQVIDRLAEAARGSPRFAVEVARTLVEAGGAPEAGDDWDLPTSLLAAYRRRLDALSKSARDVARCIAVVGGRSPLSIVHTASGLDDHRFAGAISELERRRVIEMDHRSERDTAALHSEALRTAILDSLSAAQARTLHRRAAAAWLKRVGRTAAAAGNVARHLYAAGETRAAFPHALEAAHRAGEALDYSTARRWMAQIGDPGASLDEVSSEAVYRYHMLRFLLSFADGELDDAQEQIEVAARQAPDAVSRLTTGVACARLHTRTGNYLAAVKVCRRGLKEARDERCVELGVLFAIQGSRAARRSGDNTSALAWLSEADLLLRANPGHDALEVRTAWTRSAVLLELKREDEAEREIRRAIDLALNTGQERAEAGLRTNLSVIHWRRGEIDRASDEVERSVRIFEEMGERDQVALNESNLAELMLMHGRPKDSVRYARSCWQTFRRLRDRQGTILSAATMLAVARTMQDQAGAEAVIEAVGEGPGPGETMEALWAVYWLERARWHRSRRQNSVAWHCVEQASRALGKAPPAYRRREVDLARAELMYDRGQAGRALPLLENVVAGAEEEMHWPVAWWARAVRSAVRAQLGKPDEPRQPPEQLVRFNLPLALASTWYLGAAFEIRGQIRRSLAIREEGLELARSCGFQDWVSQFERLAEE